MTRTANPDRICGLCDEFDLDQVANGRAPCLVRAEQKVLAVSVPWGGPTCVSYRLDIPRLRRRRQFIEVCRRAAADQEADPSQRSTESSYEPQ